MPSETRTCQSCRQGFTIESDDFGFYEQMKVPPPTFCPQCRLLRRLNWYSYRILHKRKCDFTGENIITFYHPDDPYKVYKQEAWWGDGWDPLSYGRDYDFSRSFFEQFKELIDAVPRAALHTEYTTMINSDYCNAASYQRNGYLCFKHITGEDTAYTNVALRTKNSLDLAYSSDPELCYEVVNVHKCYEAFFSQDCEDCRNIYFCRDLVGCSDCVGCTNLRQQQYCWFNEQLTKEEYQKRFKTLDLGSMAGIKAIRKQADAVALQQPRRAFHGSNNVSSSGDYVYNCRNVNNAYFVSDSENVRYAQLFIKGGTKNAYDFSAFGSTSEWVYEGIWSGLNTNNLKFSFWNYRNHDCEYTFGCHGCGNLFGCAGMKKGEYCILNKQYTKEEYHALVAKIKKQMMEVPFIDSHGHQYRYGEPLPLDFCPWAYNESTAYEFFPLAKEEAIKQGYKWRDPDPREYRDATIQIPEHIKDVQDDILKAILKCESCGKNYQIIPMELQFLRRFNIAIPRQCPLCRDRSRIKQLNSMQIYDRKCDKCSQPMQTSYSPTRPEIVYCESCYQKEVV